MASGDGVSAQDLGNGRWRIRWRERKPDGTWKSEEKTLTGSVIERDGYMLRIRAALAKDGTFDRRADERRHTTAEPANLIDMIEACITAREASGKYRGRTPATYRSYKTHLAENLHAIFNIPADRVLPVTVLSREAFEKYIAMDASAGLSAVMKYAPLGLLMNVWEWAAEGNAEAARQGRVDPWPCLPEPPKTRKDYLPRAPKYGRTVAPTIAHMDACLRHLPLKASRATRHIALFMRYTGLRTSQVLAIHREDIDLQERTLFVREGKTEAEKSDPRTVPIAKTLLADPSIRARIVGTTQGLLFANDVYEDATRKAPAKTLRAAWEAATAAGQVPKHVWHPRNRKYGRPDHAFRAGLKAHLGDARVDADVIDFLVGYDGASVRDVHYGRDLLMRARKAVDDIPPVDWMGPKADLGENVLAMRAR